MELIFPNTQLKIKKEIKKNLKVSNSNKIPFRNKIFDLAYSINTFHNLYNYDLEKSLKEISRVSKKQYICGVL